MKNIQFITVYAMFNWLLFFKMLLNTLLVNIHFLFLEQCVVNSLDFPADKFKVLLYMTQMFTRTFSLICFPYFAVDEEVILG